MAVLRYNTNLVDGHIEHLTRASEQLYYNCCKSAAAAAAAAAAATAAAAAAVAAAAVAARLARAESLQPALTRYCCSSLSRAPPGRALPRLHP